MKTLPQAQELASAMVAIGRAAGIATSAVISDMSQPEGRAIGNALEVREAIEVLHRRGPGDVGALVEALGSTLGVELRRAGAAEKLAEMIDAQGGDARVVDEPDRLPSARFRRFVAPPLHGYVASIDAEALGRIAVGLGAGRARKGDVIDPAVGLVLEAKIGDWTDAQQPLAIVHANDEARLEEALSRLPDAYTFSNESVRPPEQILGVSKAP